MPHNKQSNISSESANHLVAARTFNSAMLVILLQIHTIYTLSVAVTANSASMSMSTPPVPCLVEQASSLLRLKHSFSSAVGDLTTFQSWIAGTDCCSWEGVSCGNTDGRVTSLDLGGRQLQAGGGLDPALFNLTSLSHLDLSGNDFNMSQLPSTGFEQLTALTHLDLSDTNFAGSVPSGIGRHSGLVYLDLSTSFYEYDYDTENKALHYSYSIWQLSVPNMATLLANLTNLEELHLGMVNLSASGAGWCDDLATFNPKIQVLSLPYCSLGGQICKSLSALRSLRVIELHYNHLSGSVPEFLASAFPNLTVLELSRNKFEGQFPPIIFQHKMLQTVDISENLGISGVLPTFTEDSSLENLFVNNTNFSGTIPGSIGNLKSLKKLGLGASGFSGILPSSIGELKSLELLDVSGLQLVGSIPSWISNLTSLRVLRFYYCGLSGPVPPWIGNLTNLTKLALFGCNFSGTIPPKISNLTQLQMLLLQSNSFIGTVQLSAFSTMQNLTVINLSNNELQVVDGENSSSLMALQKLEYLRLVSCRLSSFPKTLRHLNRIQGLDLSDNQIHGAVPEWVWENWKDIILLNLSHNKFSSLGSDPLLPVRIEYFDLSFNNFTGPIPIPRDGSITLDYSSNKFSSIPLDYSSYLGINRFLKASRNNLSGNISTLICGRFRNLELIDLSYNNFSGAIPSCLMKDVSKLQVLNLRGNKLDGELPDSINKGCALEVFDLSGNWIEGKIPRSLVACRNLQVLDIGSNQINDSFPCWMSTLPKLQVLVLKSNNFTGPLLDPSYDMVDGNKCAFTELRIADVSSNNFSGTLPVGWFKMLKSMKTRSDNETLVMQNQYYHGQTYHFTAAITYKGYMTNLNILRTLVLIDISDNAFCGTIPESIGDLVLLLGLNMSHNDLAGPIPSQFGSLKQLESLDLSSNELSGEIPEELASLNFLSTLNLSYNMLAGRIPESSQFSTFSNSSFLGNTGLCGPPVSKQCSNQTETNMLHALDNDFEDVLLFMFTALGFGIFFSITVIVIWGRDSTK